LKDSFQIIFGYEQLKEPFYKYKIFEMSNLIV